MESWAIAQHVPVGLTSVIVQSQALFTVAFAALAFREIPTRMQMAGIAVAAVGLLMICGTVGFDFSVGAFAVLLISPVSFAIGNLLLRQARDVPMFDLFAWLCLVPPLPLLALALVIDGPHGTWQSLSHLSLEMLRYVRFDVVHVAAYSPRPGTVSATWPQIMVEATLVTPSAFSRKTPV